MSCGEGAGKGGLSLQLKSYDQDPDDNHYEHEIYWRSDALRLLLLVFVLLKGESLEVM